MFGVIIVLVLVVKGNSTKVFVFKFDGWLRGVLAIRMVMRIIIIFSCASSSNRYTVGEIAA